MVVWVEGISIKINYQHNDLSANTLIHQTAGDGLLSMGID
jgi:hypothetical protein